MRIAVQFKSASNFAVRRVQQDAFPNRAHDPPKCKRFGEKIMRHLIIKRGSDAKPVSTFADRARTPPAGPNHSACQNKPRFLRVNFKRNIRLSFALRSRAAQLFQPSRSNGTWLLEPFTRGGLSCFKRTLASTRSIYGASNPGPTL